MLLHGATLVSEPCPYCSGVRIIKDGNALCIGCGKEPKEREGNKIAPTSTLQVLEKKLEMLSEELNLEADLCKQQEIIKSIDLLAEAIIKLKNANC